MAGSYISANCPAVKRLKYRNYTLNPYSPFTGVNEEILSRRERMHVHTLVTS